MPVIKDVIEVFILCVVLAGVVSAVGAIWAWKKSLKNKNKENE